MPVVNCEFVPDAVLKACTDEMKRLGTFTAKNIEDGIADAMHTHAVSQGSAKTIVARHLAKLKKEFKVQKTASREGRAPVWTWVPSA